MKFPVIALIRANWVDLVVLEEGRQIVSTMVQKDWIIWIECHYALPHIYYVAKNQPIMTAKVIVFDEQAYAIGVDPDLEYDTDMLRFTYTSPTTPSQIFDFSFFCEQRILHKTQEIPSGHDPLDYITLRTMASYH